MSIQLSNIQERVERTFYESVRLALVELGYWPDITQYPETNQGAIDFKQAVTSIHNSKGFAIEIFGFSNAQAKGSIYTPRIVFQSRKIVPGDVGTPLTEKEVNGNTYTLFKLPFTSSNFQIIIKLVTSTAKQDRILNSIVNAVFSTRGYLNLYDAINNKIFR